MTVLRLHFRWSQGEAGHSSKSTDEVKSEAVPPHSHMSSWYTPLPFFSKAVLYVFYRNHGTCYP
jgi:hypothetical protein